MESGCFCINCVCLGPHTHSVCAEVRGHLAEAGSLFHHVDSGAQPQWPDSAACAFIYWCISPALHPVLTTWLGTAGRSSVTWSWEERPKGSKLKTKTGWAQEVWHKLWRSTASCILFSGERWDKVSRNCHSLGWRQQGSNQTTLFKGNTVSREQTEQTEALWLITMALNGEKSRVLRIWSHSSLKALTPDHYWPCQA